MIPWLYLLLSRYYFKNLKTLRENPELAHKLHRWAGFLIAYRIAVAAAIVVLSPILLLIVISAALTVLTDWLDRHIPKPWTRLHRKAENLQWDISHTIREKRAAV